MPDTSAGPAGPVAALAALRDHIGPDCRRCKLCELGRSRVVFGEGDPRARVMFVGEGPGEDEDRTGRPFVGRAGQLLTRMIYAAGFTREQVYIANIVKCRPPGNRKPEPDEAAVCGAFVRRQIEIVNPEIVVALGATAAAYLLNREVQITKIRGRRTAWHGRTLIPTFHPSYLLRTESAKKDAWADLREVAAAVGVTPRSREEVERLVAERGLI